MRIVMIGAAFILTACGQSPDSGDSVLDPSKPIAESAPTQAEASPDDGPAIRKISDAELATALGSECPSVTKSEYKGKTSDQVFYAVQCGSRETLLGINFDGSTKGVPCSLAETLNTPCWRAWEKAE